MSYTPGPWFQRVGALGVESEDGMPIAIAMDEADARLISAAPELLSACKVTLGWMRRIGEIAAMNPMSSPGMLERDIAQLVAAIKKSEAG